MTFYPANINRRQGIPRYKDFEYCLAVTDSDDLELPPTPFAMVEMDESCLIEAAVKIYPKNLH